MAKFLFTRKRMILSLLLIVVVLAAGWLALFYGSSAPEIIQSRILTSTQLPLGQDVTGIYARSVPIHLSSPNVLPYYNDKANTFTNYYSGDYNAGQFELNNKWHSCGTSNFYNTYSTDDDKRIEGNRSLILGPGACISTVMGRRNNEIKSASLFLSARSLRPDKKVSLLFGLSQNDSNSYDIDLENDREETTIVKIGDHHQIASGEGGAVGIYNTGMFSLSKGLYTKVVIKNTSTENVIIDNVREAYFQRTLNELLGQKDVTNIIANGSFEFGNSTLVPKGSTNGDTVVANVGGGSYAYNNTISYRNYGIFFKPLPLSFRDTIDFSYNDRFNIYNAHSFVAYWNGTDNRVYNQAPSDSKITYHAKYNSAGTNEGYPPEKLQSALNNYDAWAMIGDPGVGQWEAPTNYVLKKDYTPLYWIHEGLCNPVNKSTNTGGFLDRSLVKEGLFGKWALKFDTKGSNKESCTGQYQAIMNTAGKKYQLEFWAKATHEKKSGTVKASLTHFSKEMYKKMPYWLFQWKDTLNNGDGAYDPNSWPVDSELGWDCFNIGSGCAPWVRPARDEQGYFTRTDGTKTRNFKSTETYLADNTRTSHGLYSQFTSPELTNTISETFTISDEWKQYRTPVFTVPEAEGYGDVTPTKEQLFTFVYGKGGNLGFEMTVPGDNELLIDGVRLVEIQQTPVNNDILIPTNLSEVQACPTTSTVVQNTAGGVTIDGCGIYIKSIGSNVGDKYQLTFDAYLANGNATHVPFALKHNLGSTNVSSYEESAETRILLGVTEGNAKQIALNLSITQVDAVNPGQLAFVIGDSTGIVTTPSIVVKNLTLKKVKGQSIVQENIKDDSMVFNPDLDIDYGNILGQFMYNTTTPYNTRIIGGDLGGANNIPDGWTINNDELNNPTYNPAIFSYVTWRGEQRAKLDAIATTKGKYGRISQTMEFDELPNGSYQAYAIVASANPGEQVAKGRVTLQVGNTVMSSGDEDNNQVTENLSTIIPNIRPENPWTTITTNVIKLQSPVNKGRIAVRFDVDAGHAVYIKKLGIIRSQSEHDFILPNHNLLDTNQIFPASTGNLIANDAVPNHWSIGDCDQEIHPASKKLIQSSTQGTVTATISGNEAQCVKVQSSFNTRLGDSFVAKIDLVRESGNFTALPKLVHNPYSGNDIEVTETTIQSGERQGQSISISSANLTSQQSVKTPILTIKKEDNNNGTSTLEFRLRLEGDGVVQIKGFRIEKCQGNAFCGNAGTTGLATQRSFGLDTDQLLLNSSLEDDAGTLPINENITIENNRILRILTGDQNKANSVPDGWTFTANGDATIAYQDFTSETSNETITASKIDAQANVYYNSASLKQELNISQLPQGYYQAYAVVSSANPGGRTGRASIELSTDKNQEAKLNRFIPIKSASRDIADWQIITTPILQNRADQSNVNTYVTVNVEGGHAVYIEKIGLIRTDTPGELLVFNPTFTDGQKLFPTTYGDLYGKGTTNGIPEGWEVTNCGGGTGDITLSLVQGEGAKFENKSNGRACLINKSFSNLNVGEEYAARIVVKRAVPKSLEVSPVLIHNFLSQGHYQREETGDVQGLRRNITQNNEVTIFTPILRIGRTDNTFGAPNFGSYLALESNTDRDAAVFVKEFRVTKCTKNANDTYNEDICNGSKNYVQQQLLGSLNLKQLLLNQKFIFDQNILPINEDFPIGDNNSVKLVSGDQLAENSIPDGWSFNKALAKIQKVRWGRRTPDVLRIDARDSSFAYHPLTQELEFANLPKGAYQAYALVTSQTPATVQLNLERKSNDQGATYACDSEEKQDLCFNRQENNPNFAGTARELQRRFVFHTVVTDPLIVEEDAVNNRLRVQLLTRSSEMLYVAKIGLIRVDTPDELLVFNQTLTDTFGYEYATPETGNEARYSSSPNGWTLSPKADGQRKAEITYGTATTDNSVVKIENKSEEQLHFTGYSFYNTTPGEEYAAITRVRKISDNPVTINFKLRHNWETDTAEVARAETYYLENNEATATNNITLSDNEWYEVFTPVLQTSGVDTIQPVPTFGVDLALHSSPTKDATLEVDYVKVVKCSEVNGAYNKEACRATTTIPEAMAAKINEVQTTTEVNNAITILGPNNTNILAPTKDTRSNLWLQEVDYQEGSAAPQRTAVVYNDQLQEAYFLAPAHYALLTNEVNGVTGFDMLGAPYLASAGNYTAQRFEYGRINTAGSIDPLASSGLMGYGNQYLTNTHLTIDEYRQDDASYFGTTPQFFGAKMDTVGANNTPDGWEFAKKDNDNEASVTIDTVQGSTDGTQAAQINFGNNARIQQFLKIPLPKKKDYKLKARATFAEPSLAGVSMFAVLNPKPSELDKTTPVYDNLGSKVAKIIDGGQVKDFIFVTGNKTIETEELSFNYSEVDFNNNNNEGYDYIGIILTGQGTVTLKSIELLDISDDANEPTFAITSVNQKLPFTPTYIANQDSITITVPSSQTVTLDDYYGVYFGGDIQKFGTITNRNNGQLTVRLPLSKVTQDVYKSPVSVLLRPSSGALQGTPLTLSSTRNLVIE